MIFETIFSSQSLARSSIFHKIADPQETVKFLTNWGGSSIAEYLKDIDLKGLFQESKYHEKYLSMIHLQPSNMGE